MTSATDLNELPIRVGLGQFNEATDERLQFIKQCGVDDFLLNTARLSGENRWEYEDLAALCKMAEEHKLRLMALENVPHQFCDKIMLGLYRTTKLIAHTRDGVMSFLCYACINYHRFRGNDLGFTR